MTALFITILNMSITASVVALAVMLARVPLRKVPKVFSYVLWGVVLFRLVFPFSIESVFSLMPTSRVAIPQSIVYSSYPTIHTGVQFIDTPINAVINNALPPVVQEYSINPIHVFFEIGGYVWFAGLVALLLYALMGYVGLKRRVYFATLVRDNIYESDKINTPFVLGFIRPKIYFPVSIDPSQHDYILKHEQTHIKRRDYIIKPFAYAVFALHWFNPLMWISYFLMSKDMEMSCDEAVLRNTSEDIRNDYSTSLLNLSVKRVSLLNPIAFAFGESNVKERVVNVLNFKKTAKWVSVISFIAIAVFLVGFISDRAILAAIDVPQSQAAPRSGQLMTDTAISFETAREIAIRYSGIEQPDLADIRRVSGDNDMQSWHFAVGGNGRFVVLTIDAETGDVRDVVRFGAESAWPIESLPISYETAMDITLEYLDISEPLAVYFNGLTIIDNRPVSYYWLVRVIDLDIAYDVQINAQSGEVYSVSRSLAVTGGEISLDLEILTITAEEALRIARDYVDRASRFSTLFSSDVTRLVERGALQIWHVTLHQIDISYDIYVDAITGNVWQPATVYGEIPVIGGNIEIHIPFIAAGEEVLVGRLNLEMGQVFEVSADSEEGNGIFVGITSVPLPRGVQGRHWQPYSGRGDSGNVTTTITHGDARFVYLFAGSTEFSRNATDLINVTIRFLMLDD